VIKSRSVMMGTQSEGAGSGTLEAVFGAVRARCPVSWPRVTCRGLLTPRTLGLFVVVAGLYWRSFVSEGDSAKGLEKGALGAGSRTESQIGFPTASKAISGNASDGDPDECTRTSAPDIRHTPDRSIQHIYSLAHRLAERNSCRPIERASLGVPRTRGNGPSRNTVPLVTTPT